LLNNFIESLINRPKILIFDEVNKVYNLVDFFNTLNTIYRATNVPIILISNKINLLDSMPEDARLTLFFQRMVFKPYSPQELKSIGTQRLKLLPFNPEFPEDSLAYICAKCADSGSARQLLYLIQMCLSQKNYSYEFIDTIEKEIKRQDWEQWANSLKDFEKKFLNSILNLHFHEIENNNGNGEIKVAQIQKELPDLSPQRISQLITSFREYGLLDTRYINQGKKGGRYRLVSFSNNEVAAKLSNIL